MIALPQKHLFTADAWQQLGQTGVFPPDWRAELIEGEIFDMPPIGTTHCGCVDWLSQYFIRRLPEQYGIRAQNPLRLGDLSEPQPDILILRHPPKHYRDHHPGADDVLLLIEVADSTLSYDRNTKTPLYARFGIGEYWIINLPDTQVEIHAAPVNGKYQHHHLATPGERLIPHGISGIEVAVDEIFA
jgi:Uma2 family endonuclease